jgi:lactoylglutathione lyase
MKQGMYLYEMHLPVKDTEVSSRFYIDVVGLEYAYRDLTRDAVFLWIGSNKRSMLGLWGPTTLWGQSRRCHFAVAVALSDLLAAGSYLGAFGIVTRDFSGKVTTDHR